MLSYGEQALNTTIDAAAQALRDKNVRELCGARFCPSSVSAGVNPNLKQPDMSKIHILMGIFLALMVAAVLLVSFGVDSLKRYVSMQIRDNLACGLTQLH